MKIVLFAEYYEKYLRDFHAAHATKLAGLSYRDHADFLTKDFFGAFGSYLHHFRRIGHDAELIVANYYPLQQKWLDESGASIQAGPETREKVVLAQLEAMKPDAFFMGSMFQYYGPFLEKVASITPNIVTWIACPYPDGLDFRRVKCVLSNNLEFPKIFREKGVNSEQLLAAFDPDILDALQKRPKSIPLSFIGGVSTQHTERIQALNWLIKNNAPLQIWGYIERSRVQRVLHKFYKSPIERRHRGPIWGLAMYQALADSKITFNYHIDISRQTNWGGNMRTYEATGCGALLLTDYAPGMENLFVPGKEVVMYRSLGELAEVLKRCLEREDETAAISKAGQAACLARHSYTQRIKEFEAILFRYCS